MSAIRWSAAPTLGMTLVLACGSGVQDVPAEQVRAAIREQIQADRGELSLENPAAGDHVDLSFDHVHEGVKRTGGGRYFACVDFQGPDGTLYDVDYYVDSADYSVEDVVMHKKAGQSVLSEDERARLDSKR